MEYCCKRFTACICRYVHAALHQVRLSAPPCKCRHYTRTGKLRWREFGTPLPASSPLEKVRAAGDGGFCWHSFKLSGLV